MGNWSVFRRLDGDRAEAKEGLTVDSAFGYMMELARSRWAIVAKAGGGYRLELTRLGPVPDLPYADAEMVAEHWPRVESDSEDRRTAERDIKEEMLYHGRDGVESFYMPMPGGEDPVTERLIQRLVKRGIEVVPLEDEPPFN